MATPSKKDESFVFSTEFFDDATNPLSPSAAVGDHRPKNVTAEQQPHQGDGTNTPLTPSRSGGKDQAEKPSAPYSVEGLPADTTSTSDSALYTTATKLSSSEPAFVLEALNTPTTAETYWAAEAQINTARQGLFGDLRRCAMDVYGATAPYSETHLWGSKPLWYTRTKAPNCNKKEAFRVLIRRTHWPRTIGLYLAFTVMPVLASVANRNLAHWAMILFYWIPWAATMVVILLMSFTNPGIVPRRLDTHQIKDTGDVIIVRVPAPNAERVLEKLQSLVVAEEGQPMPPSAPAPSPPTESMEQLRRLRAERLLSSDSNANFTHSNSMSVDQPQAVPVPSPLRSTIRVPTGTAAEQHQDSVDMAEHEAYAFPARQPQPGSPVPLSGRGELSGSMSFSAMQLSEKNPSSTSRPRLATFAALGTEADVPPSALAPRDSTTAPLLSASRNSQDPQQQQQRRRSMAASSLLSQRSVAASNNRYFVNSTGVITSELPPMSPEELETPHIEVPFRLCRTCHVFRGPRTHHCHKCDNCVDELDHHCPWTNSCVGRHNYSYFLLALALIHVTMLYIVFNNVYLTFMYLNDHIHANYADYLAETYYLPPIIYAAAFIVGFYFSGLGMSHIYMNVKGITTFELIKYVFIDSSYYNGVNPWDKGVWHNCVDRLFGLNAIKWLDSRYYYPVTVAFILEEKLLDWRLALPDAERALVDAEESRRRRVMAQAREQQARDVLNMA